MRSIIFFLLLLPLAMAHLSLSLSRFSVCLFIYLFSLEIPSLLRGVSCLLQLKVNIFTRAWPRVMNGNARGKRHSLSLHSVTLLTLLRERTRRTPRRNKFHRLTTIRKTNGLQLVRARMNGSLDRCECEAEWRINADEELKRSPSGSSYNSLFSQNKIWIYTWLLRSTLSPIFFFFGVKHNICINAFEILNTKRKRIEETEDFHFFA